jgi:hypothetical protein
MPTPTRKQATKRAPAKQSNAVTQDARRVDRATRRERADTSKQKIEDVVIDRGFHAPAEDIEIDPQLDESESAEP